MNNLPVLHVNACMQCIRLIINAVWIIWPCHSWDVWFKKEQAVEWEADFTDYSTDGWKHNIKRFDVYLLEDIGYSYSELISELDTNRNTVAAFCAELPSQPELPSVLFAWANPVCGALVSSSWDLNCGSNTYCSVTAPQREPVIALQRMRWYYV